MNHRYLHGIAHVIDRSRRLLDLPVIPAYVAAATFGALLLTMIEHHRGRSVSIALCTYNGEKYLPQLLASLLDQTELPDELVVQDDRSTDSTMALLERFVSAARFPVRLIVNHENMGPSRNFETCLARCDSDVIILTDQDDVWMPDRVSRTRAAHHDPRVAFTFSDAPLIDDGGAPLERSIFDSVPIRAMDRPRLASGDDLLAMIMRYGILYGTTMSVSRETVAEALPIPSGWSHDEWLSLVGATLGTSRRLEPVTRYRQHADQVVGVGPSGNKVILAGARERTISFYDTELARFDAAVQSTRAHPALAVAVQPLLQAKLSFFQARQAMRQRGWRGLGLLLREIRKGNYGRFAGGPRSVLKDLALMAGRAPSL